MPRMRRPDFDRRVVTRPKLITLGPDRENWLTAEDVEPFLERMHVRINGAQRRELVDAQPGMDGPCIPA